MNGPHDESSWPCVRWVAGAERRGRSAIPHNMFAAQPQSDRVRAITTLPARWGIAAVWSVGKTSLARRPQAPAIRLKTNEAASELFRPEAVQLSLRPQIDAAIDQGWRGVDILAELGFV